MGGLKDDTYRLTKNPRHLRALPPRESPLISTSDATSALTRSNPAGSCARRAERPPLRTRDVTDLWPGFIKPRNRPIHPLVSGTAGAYEKRARARRITAS